jgi:hypothetical protein
MLSIAGSSEKSYPLVLSKTPIASTAAVVRGMSRRRLKTDA